MKKNNVLFQLLSCLIFSLLGLQIKFLSISNSIETIVFFRCFLGAFFMIFFSMILKKKIKKIFFNKYIKIHLIRAIFGIVAMYCGYKALSIISLSLASTIGFTKVFFTSLLATIILKESVNYKNILLIVFGFLGIYLIALPSAAPQLEGLVFGLTSALFVSGGIISVSYLTKKDNTVNILMFHSVISSFLVFLIFYKGISFDISDNFFYLILMTLTALSGQYFNTESYRNEKANIIIVVSYSRIIFSTVLGFLILDEKIDLVSLLGIMIIIFTTFFVKKYSVNKN